MEIKELSEILIKESGRYDLQNADGTDNGLLRYLNSGQRMLDRKANILQSSARNYTAVDEGAYYLTIPECRIVETVWLLDQPMGEDATRIPLTELPWDNLQMRFPKVASNNTLGKPLFYARGSFRSAPSNELNIAENMNSFAGFDDTFVDDGYDVNGIFFGPPSDAQYGFQIVGKFYTKSIDAKTTSTMWSVLHPELLIMAARFWMEVMNRNTEGRRDWESVINDQLVDLDKDKVEQYCRNGLVMGDSE